MSIARLMQQAAAGVPTGGGAVEFVGYNDTNLQGSYTLDYPTGTQSGDLLFLFCGNDGAISTTTPSGWTRIVEGYAPIEAFYRTAGAESSVIAPAGTTPSIGGAIISSFRNAAYVQSNTLNSGTGHTPPTSFTSFSGATVNNSCVCFVWYDDDVQSGDATQTDFSVIVSDFYGTGAGAGCSMNATYALNIVDSTTFTPPDLNASGITSEGYSSWAFEIEPTVTPAAPSWTDPDLANASYDSVSFSVGDCLGMDFSEDGSNLYVNNLTFPGGDITQYSLSTPWDISTASSTGNSLDTDAQEDVPYGIKFSPDGTKLLVAGDLTDSIYEYTLSTAWDISTATYSNNSLSVSAQETSVDDLAFNSDGSKLFVLGSSSDSVLQYSLASNYSLASASYDAVSFSVSAQTNSPAGLFFSPNGDKLFVTSNNPDSVFQYSLSSSFDLSTASYDSVSFSIGSQTNSNQKVRFKSDGSKMYISDNTTDTIYQYSTA